MGLPGSGKTTFSKQVNGLAIHVDEIRKALTGSYKPDGSNDLVHQVTQKTVYYHLERGKTVVVDGALLSKKTRSNYVRMAKKLHIDIELYWLDPSYDLFKQRLLERNQTSEPERKMDWQYVDKLSRLLEIPSMDEGFAVIHHLSDADLR